MPLPFLRSRRRGETAYQAYQATHPETAQRPWSGLTRTEQRAWQEIGDAVVMSAYEAWRRSHPQDAKGPWGLLSSVDQQAWASVCRAVLDADTRRPAAAAAAELGKLPAPVGAPQPCVGT
jgi:hypothetical protein